MDDKKRADVMEAALAELLRPLKNIPFSAVVRSLANQSILPIDRSNEDDKRLIKSLEKAASAAGNELQANPIIRARPNEVGNDVEKYVKRAVVGTGLKCESPRGASGKAKSTGYPDLLVTDNANRPTYLECKIYSAKTADSSMRSFYVSPSKDFKVSCDARHLLLAFEMEVTTTGGSSSSEYRAVGWKLADLHDLLCDVKYEFNSDNRRLYLDSALLAKGRIG